MSRKSSSFKHGGSLLHGSTGRVYHPRLKQIQRRPLKNGMPDVLLSDRSALRELPNFDPALEFEYSRRELLLLAEKILTEDPKDMHEDPAWLPADALRRREKPEIYVGSGTPDPSVNHGLYWRTHPSGRRWRTRRERSKGGGFYV